jgi:hypothetical protein
MFKPCYPGLLSEVDQPLYSGQRRHGTEQKINLPLLKLFNVQRLKLSWQRQEKPMYNGVAG